MGSLTADALLPRMSCGLPSFGVGFFVWARGEEGGGVIWRTDLQLQEMHRHEELRKKKRVFVVIFGFLRDPCAKRGCTVLVPVFF